MQIKTVGIVGLGYMGRGIAASLISHGFRTLGFTKPAEGFEAAKRAIADGIADMIAHGAAPESLSRDWPSRYVEAASIDQLGDCDFVIESVVENLQVKREVFRELEGAVGPSVPITTNTSALPISLLQSGARHPNRIAGMHFCPPCYNNQFLEVIRGDETDETTCEAAMELGRALGKKPGLVRKDVPGFIVNRLSYAVYREAFHLIESGVADAQTIDDVFRSAMGVWSGAVGPLRWMDLTGFELYAAVMARLFPTLSTSSNVPASFQRLIDQGARGTANGSGFFRYGPGEADRWHKMLAEHNWDMMALSEKYRRIVEGKP
jgi:3-hydroxybutyryl-CoA dehydrogenase